MSCQIVAELIIHNNRLSTSDENGRNPVGATSISSWIGSGNTCSIRVQLKSRVGNAHIRLMHFNQIKLIEIAFNRSLAATVS